MITCYRCAKTIKGTVVKHEPPLLSIELGIDSPKSFHPKCYEMAEREACKELRTNGDCFDCPDWKSCDFGRDKKRKS